ncbi:threonine synthase [Alicyclobacillus cycloheptanicus]|uniref:Threonine synthase n=1 Tax=Alicyclobacillus cycloheptanicus TaxID=1457 RepID=A0ABT9XGC8_9BACL|nr:threonine synthase [Alicyclobacillus cycloheptanicus]MDQ0189185.1 threonine synthase [Alicyclobacillus cycloheptanicus]
MQNYSHLSHLTCTRCHRTYPVTEVRERCDCGGILFAAYDLKAVQRTLGKPDLAARPQTLWRYHELLPIQKESSIVSLHEGMTPLLQLPRVASQFGVPNLLVKDEGRLPSGTFKARGASVGISRAKELGVSGVAIPTNGNAGAAWALYAARAGLPILVVMPTTAPVTPRKECVVSGARVVTINGTIGDAGRVVREAAKRYGWYDVSTFNEPYRLEGKKTMGLEIAEQFGWSVPDVIVYPTGGGAGVVGIYKGLLELQQMGWIGAKMPRFALIQSEGCAPLARAFAKGERETTRWEDPQTIAFGMRVPKPAADYLLLDILYRTNGTVTTVSDAEVQEVRRMVGEWEGFHVCPEGAAGFAGLRRLRKAGWLTGNERVLLVNTGTGLKYIDQIADDAREMDLADLDLEALALPARRA